MKKYLLSILLLFLSSVCIADTIINNATLNNFTYTNLPIILPIGDSITIGVTWAYRKTLQILQGSGKYYYAGIYKNPSSDPLYQVNNSGQSGNTTSQISTRLSTELTNNFSGNVPLGSSILIHAGTNDVVGIGTSGVASAVNNVQSMLNNIYAVNSKVNTYVALIVPNQNGTDDSSITYYNSQLKNMLNTFRLTNAKVHIVDMNSAFKNDTFGLCGGDWSANCMANATHPNELPLHGYDVMGYQWNSCIQSSSNTNCDGN